MNNQRAWVTLATNDTYSLGALVLAHSLKKVNTKYDLVILITSNVTGPMRDALQSVFHQVKEVNLLDSGDTENLRLLARPELGITFTKLHCWRLTQYEKCVFLDADTLVLQNCDDVFEREELSAAPDVGWPDCFNSGVFVFKPSEETYKNIIDFALANGSFDGGDQGLLNMYFSNWATGDSSKRLPFLYNLSSAAIYSYLPAFKWYGKGVKIVHFIGNSKPWQQSFNSVSRTVSTTVAESAHLINFYQYWWNLFCAVVHPHLSPEMTGLAQTLSQMKLEEPTPEQLAQEDLLRRQNWEQGNIDYLGRDSFDNIWSKISQTISPDTEPTAQQSEDSAPSVTQTSASSSQPPSAPSSPAPKLEPILPRASEPAPVSESEPKLAPTPTPSVTATAEPTVVAAESPVVAADPPVAAVTHSLASSVTADSIQATVADSQEAIVDSSTLTNVPEIVAAPSQAVVTPEVAPTSAEKVEISSEGVPTRSETTETSLESHTATTPPAEVSPVESQPQSEASDEKSETT